MAYTLTTKSQVTLPKAIREYLRVAPGNAVEFRIVADGGVRVEPAAELSKPQLRAASTARKRFAALRGSGGQAGQAEQLGTDALMRMLRGYDDDASDPGFARQQPKAGRRK